MIGSEGRRSQCEPYREVILSKIAQGLSAQRIWQDLAEQGFADGYQSVQRFVGRLRAGTPLPFRRMECEPGQELQIDFGARRADYQRPTEAASRAAPGAEPFAERLQRGLVEPECRVVHPSD